MLDRVRSKTEELFMFLLMLLSITCGNRPARTPWYHALLLNVFHIQVLPDEGSFMIQQPWPQQAETDYPKAPRNITTRIKFNLSPPKCLTSISCSLYESNIWLVQDEHQQPWHILIFKSSFMVLHTKYCVFCTIREFVFC